MHDSRVALPLTRISAQRVDACYELMDAAYCSTVFREDIQAAGRVPLIDHNPRNGDKREFAPHEAQRYKTRSGAERCNARLRMWSGITSPICTGGFGRTASLQDAFLAS